MDKGSIMVQTCQYMHCGGTFNNQEVIRNFGYLLSNTASSICFVHGLAPWHEVASSLFPHYCMPTLGLLTMTSSSKLNSTKSIWFTAMYFLLLLWMSATIQYFMTLDWTELPFVMGRDQWLIFPTDGAKLMMPKSLVGSLVQFGSLDDLVGPAR